MRRLSKYLFFATIILFPLILAGIISADLLYFVLILAMTVYASSQSTVYISERIDKFEIHIVLSLFMLSVIYISLWTLAVQFIFSNNFLYLGSTFGGPLLPKMALLTAFCSYVVFIKLLFGALSDSTVTGVRRFW